MSRRGALSLSGSGRGVMKLDDPNYIGVRRYEFPTPERSGRSSSRASTISVVIEELENRLRQEMIEIVGAFAEQLRKIQQEYQENADEVHMRHPQVKLDALKAS